MSILEMKVPSPGESITEVEIASWLVKDGDFVEKDQPIEPIPTLTDLNIFMCELTDINIKNLTNISKLYLYGNNNISDLNHLVNLTELSAQFCNLNSDCIKNLTNLKKITIAHNSNTKLVNQYRGRHLKI